MNRILLATLGACALVGCAPSSTTVTGKAEDGQVVYLFKKQREAPIDSVTVSGGSFSFVINQDEMPSLMYVGERKEPCAFIADGTEVEVDIVADKRGGSALNDLYESGVVQVSRQFYSRANELSEAMKNAPDGATKDSLNQLLSKASGDFEKYLSESYEKSKGTFIGCVFLGYVMYDMSPEELAAAIEENKAFGGNSILERPKSLLASYDLRAVGREYVDFEMPDTAGVNHRLSEWIGEGRYVLVDFWASWCGPCRREMPNVLANYDKYHEKGFDVLGVSFDSKHDAWVNAISSLGLKWSHVSDLKGWKSLGSELYGVRAIPCNVLIGPDGKIVASDLLEEKLGDKLKEIFGE